MQRGVCGVYAIKNTINGKVYIGQSVDVEYRICNHFSKLKWGRHDNEHLQRAYNKNPQAIEWTLLCECKQEELDAIEIAYIKEYNSADPKHGYNMQYGGQAEHRATPETRRKMSEIKKGKCFTKEHCAKIGEANRRRRLSDETKRKIGAKHSKSVIQQDMDGNYIRRFESIKQAAQEIGVSPNAIKNALTGKSRQSAGYRWQYERQETCN